MVVKRVRFSNLVQVFTFGSDIDMIINKVGFRADMFIKLPYVDFWVLRKMEGALDEFSP